MVYKNIKINMPKWVKYILDTLNENDFEAYIVGGCVRDSLLGRIPRDWDITTNAKPNEVVEIFESLGYKIIPTGLKHGTVTVVINNINYEITTFRVDGEYSDNRHPDKIEFTGNLIEDLSRRDFTINAMAYNDEIGLVDYFYGFEYLTEETISCVAEADKRFKEDALRMMRAIRFSSQLEFKIDFNTFNSIYVNSELIKNVSLERIKDELCKILLSSKPSSGIKSLYSGNILKYVLPELIEGAGFNQKNHHHDKSVLRHTLSVVDNIPPVLELRLSALLHDIAKPRTFSLDENGVGHFYEHAKISADMSREILTRLKFDNKTIDIVSNLVYNHMIPTDLNYKSIKKLIQRVGENNIYSLIELMVADRKGLSKEYQKYDDILTLKCKIDKILNEKQPMTTKDLTINGVDLLNLGFKQGKELGDVLKELLEIVLENPELNNREYLIEYVSNKFINEVKS